MPRRDARPRFGPSRRVAGSSFTEREIRAYLECGVLAHGFIRVHCDACGHDRLFAFSCKGRGFCPSCGSAIAWHALGDRKQIDLAVGAFDQPDDLKPAEHLWADSRIKWLKIEDSTPKYHEGRDSGEVS